MKVVHLSKTPLAGSPGRLSKFLSHVGVESCHFAEVDYPGELKGKMMLGSYLLDSNLSFELLEYSLSTADIVHVHNYLSKDLVASINRCFNGEKLVFHVHSPLREGPNFFDVSEMMDLHFDQKFVVAQYHPRQYQDFTPICNIVPMLANGDIRAGLSRREGPVRVMYTPAHERKGGRWNPKGSSALNTCLDYFSRRGEIELVQPPKTSSHQLQAFRQLCDITIDEIVTGSHHQISLEGLSAGNIVVNNADFFSISMLKLAAKIKEDPPFYICNEKDVSFRFEEILSLSRDELNARKLKSYDYFSKYLKPERLAKILVNHYEK